MSKKPLKPPRIRVVPTGIFFKGRRVFIESAGNKYMNLYHAKSFAKVMERYMRDRYAGPLPEGRPGERLCKLIAGSIPDDAASTEDVKGKT